MVMWPELFHFSQTTKSNLINIISLSRILVKMHLIIAITNLNDLQFVSFL